MKGIYYFILSIFFTNTSLCFGQSKESTSLINWSNEINMQKKEFLNDITILHTDLNYIYYYSYTYSFSLLKQELHYFLVKLDKKTNEYSTLDINPASDNKDLTILGVDTMDRKFHEIAYFYNKTDKKYYFFTKSFDYINLKAVSEFQKFFEIDVSERKADISNLSVSFQKKRILMTYKYSDKQGDIFGLDVFDKDFNHEWQRDSLAQTEEGIDIEYNRILDKNGNAYAVVENYPSLSDYKKHIETKRMYVVFYPKNGGTPASSALILKNNNFIINTNIEINNKNQLICTGLYAKPGTLNAIGAYCFLIEKDLSKIINVQSKDFGEELINKGVTFKSENGVVDSYIGSSFYNESCFNMGDIKVNSDGSFFVCFEKYNSMVKTTGSGNYNEYTYYYDDLWILNFNTDGTFKWIQKIPKYEYTRISSNDFRNIRKLGSYYIYHNEKENSFDFIFNLYTYGKLLSKYKSSTVEIKLDENGNEKFRELINDKEVSRTFVPSSTYTEKDGNRIFLRFNNLISFNPFSVYKHNTFNIGYLK